MKLNVRRTVLVGFAFLSISAFWQLYDSVIPLILKNDFGVGDTVSGGIMAIDNILAVFLLPFFGALSDRTHTKLGRRIPYILVGTFLAVIFMLLIPYAANSRNEILFFVALGATLLAMAVYRSPAVALMPDVTLPPLRSKANAIINLMGALGGVYYLVLARVMPRGPEGNDYTYLFIAVALLMIVSVLIVTFTIPENKLRVVEERPAKDAPASETKLQPEVQKSLILILVSVALWFLGYNAVTTAFTKYAQEMWSMDLGAAATALLVATIGAVVSYIPIGYISGKFGRKKTIMAGIVILSLCFATGFFFTSFTPALYVMFALVGFAWAAINVNSYPMVVELSQHGDTGKYTGYYYTFSMSAQIITPIISGALLEFVGYWTLFPYAAIMVALAFVTMSQVKHGDNRPDLPQDKLELLAGSGD